MSETQRCPDCGAENPAIATSCSRCNYPFRGPAEVAAPAETAASAPLREHEEMPAAEPPAAPVVESPAGGSATGEPAAAPAVESPDGGSLTREPAAPAPPDDAIPTSGFSPGPRPVRRRRARPDAAQPVVMQIWLFVGIAVVMGVLYFAAQGFWKSNAIEVAGARPEQQQRADQARRALEADSTNLAARVDLANVLYDTGNWSEAIIHYRSAERSDPQRATTVVDLGVCYYNLGQFAAAESLFHRALAIEPQQVFALFNLGIVAESQERWEEALDFYHRALRSNPPEPMKEPLQQHLQTVMQKTGKVPPPLATP